MKISLNWLTDYVEVSMPARELGELFTRIGLACDQIIETDTDVVFDLEVTSNRPDWLGHLGVARELAAATGASFRPPAAALPPGAGAVDELTSVEVLDPDLCPRYTARLVRNVKVGPSPAWLIERLEFVGMRSINNVVDITNYVLMEYSQPLHSFDQDKLAAGRIVVRRARGGEQLVSIDETRCELTSRMLVIADAARPVAVAGVMGGLDTEVTEATTNVLIESAEFDPLNVRRTSRALQLTSESNFRFERGVDPVGVETASRRACRLICELAGGQPAEGLVDVWAEPWRPRDLALRPARCSALLGMDVPAAEQKRILSALELEPAERGGKLVCTIPSHRADLTREADLIEEVARLLGYEAIPVAGQVAHTVVGESRAHRVRRSVCRVLSAAGFDETITLSFGDRAAAELFGFAGCVCVDSLTRKTGNVLRPTVLGSLLGACKTNQDAGTPEVALYELAAVFHPAPEAQLPDEFTELGLVTTRSLGSLRGAVEAVAAQVAPAARVELAAAEVPGLASGTAAAITLDGRPAGSIGYVAQKALDYYDLERRLAAAAVRFEALLDCAVLKRTYSPVPKFPGTRRDLSLIVPAETTWKQIAEVIAGVTQPLRVGLDYVTTFRGKPIPAASKSITVTLTYRAADGTLRGEQVDQQIGQVLEALEASLGAEIRK